PDFEAVSTFGTFTGLVKSVLLPDRTPEFLSSTGSGGGTSIVSSTTFGQWYHDTPNVNRRSNITLRLMQDLGADATGHTYVYDSNCSPVSATCSQVTFDGDDGGFFPIDGKLYCQGVANCSGQNSNNNWRNFDFTSEFH